MRNLFRENSLAALALLAIVTLVPAANAQNYSVRSPAVNLGPIENTTSTDGCPCVAKIGLSLYFASNRPGGFGGLDIYVSQRAELTATAFSPTTTWPTHSTRVALEGRGRFVEAASAYITAVHANPLDPRSLQHLETMIEAHPEVLRHDPALVEGVAFAREARKRFLAGLSESTELILLGRGGRRLARLNSTDDAAN